MDVTLPDATTDSYGPYGYGSGSYSTTYTDAGSYTVLVSDSYGDGGGAASASYDVGDSYTLAGTTVPSWMAFDTSTGILSGTPGDSEVGDHSIVITATDESGANASDSFTISVANVNDAPAGSSVTTTLCTLTSSSGSTDSDGDGYEDEECTFTLPAGEPLDISLVTTSYGGEAGVKLTDPSGTQTVWAHGTFSSSTTYDLSGYASSAGDYTLQVYDSYGDGCTCTATASYTATTIIQISGDVYDGETLTADSSLLTDDDGVGTLSYQWADRKSRPGRRHHGRYQRHLHDRRVLRRARRHLQRDRLVHGRPRHSRVGKQQRHGRYRVQPERRPRRRRHHQQPRHRRRRRRMDRHV